MRVAARVKIVEHEVIHRVRIVVAEPVAEVVSIAAVLSLSGGWVELAGVWVPAEVTAANVDDFADEIRIRTATVRERLRGYCRAAS